MNCKKRGIVFSLLFLLSALLVSAASAAVLDQTHELSGYASFKHPGGWMKQELPVAGTKSYVAFLDNMSAPGVSFSVILAEDTSEKAAIPKTEEEAKQILEEMMAEGSSKGKMTIELTNFETISLGGKDALLTECKGVSKEMTIFIRTVSFALDGHVMMFNTAFFNEASLTANRKLIEEVEASVSFK